MKRKKLRTIRAELRDRAGKCVRRVPIVEGTPFVFDVRAHLYYDHTKGAQYVERDVQAWVAEMRPSGADMNARVT